MTLPATPRRAGPLYGNSAATSFPFTFSATSTDEVEVILTSPAGVEARLILDSTYSVTLNPDQTTAPGGSINYPLAGDPLPDDWSITVVGALPLDQPLALPAGGNFSPASIEREFDRVVKQVQQVDEVANRALVWPASAGPAAAALPSIDALAGRLVTFDNKGRPTATSFTAQQLAQAVASTFTFWEATGIPLFGVPGDGVTDVSVQLQAALDTNRVYMLPPGLYRHTAKLIVDPARNRNCGFIGAVPTSRYPYTTQAGGPVWDGKQEAVLWYDGPTGSTTAQIAASPAPVGVDPATEGDYTAFDGTVQTFTLQDVVLDGGDKAAFGLYCARVQRLQIRRVVFMQSVEAGASINGSYSGSIESCLFTRNLNRGLELGDADARWGWSVNDKVNALFMRDIHCVANGRDKTFDETIPAQARRDCGIFYGPHRGVMLSGLVSELNWGPNIIFQPTSSGNYIDGFYTELGCRYAPDGAGSDAISMGKASQQWGMVFIGSPGATHCALSNGVLASDWAWLTGTSPTAAREEGAFEMSSVSLAGGVKADWAAYRLVNCAVELENIVGSQPAGAFTLLGGLQFGAGTDILNVYDEGTFTPTLAGASTAGTGWAYSVQAGSYTRIGRVVSFTARIALTAIGAGAAGSLELGGLPFPVRNGNNYYAACQVAGFGNLATSVVGLSARAEVNTSKLVFFKLTAASTGESTVTVADLSATATFTVSGQYVV